MDFVWETRAHQSAKHRDIPQAIEFAMQHQLAGLEGPVVLAEVTDNPGSGRFPFFISIIGPLNLFEFYFLFVY